MEVCCNYWRKRAMAEAHEAATAQAPVFVPIAFANASEVEPSEAAICKSAPGSMPCRRMIEIETAGVRVRVPEGVDVKTLSVVLAALRRASC
jgi:hypothetical protein